MISRSLRRIAVLLALLQCPWLVPGFAASADAGWTYLGLYQTGTSWGFLVRQYKFACATESRGNYVYFSQYRDYAQATADATKRCK
jgi:hypothetical protein